MASPSTALAVEQIAASADHAQPNLSSKGPELFKRNILDSLGCALGALPSHSVDYASRSKISAA